jgi:Mg2+/Co2+ transporter CorC
MDASFDIYNPGSTDISQVVTTTDVRSNKLSTVAAVVNGATKLNLNVVVDFFGAVSGLVSVVDDACANERTS